MAKYPKPKKRKKLRHGAYVLYFRCWLLYISLPYSTIHYCVYSTTVSYSKITITLTTGLGQSPAEELDCTVEIQEETTLCGNPVDNSASLSFFFHNSYPVQSFFHYDYM
uniref:Uncharacterized protein n=1 Tax=Glossina brevipalpis TaxID=37001 RepID=A0A1A9W5A5_9MUSC